MNYNLLWYYSKEDETRFWEIWTCCFKYVPYDENGGKEEASFIHIIDEVCWNEKERKHENAQGQA